MLVRRFASTLLVVTVIYGLALAGVMTPLDDRLADLRFDRLDRSPTGRVVVVDIDGESLRQIGVWPWPRRIHAEILDKLMAAGADNVVFDIDFSTRSTTADDALFAAALQRAGGFASLAVFQQSVASGVSYNLPIPEFRQYASLTAVDVPVANNGVVRSYDRAIALGGQTYPSAGVVLSALPKEQVPQRFHIDFGIDAAAIDRIPVGDLLSGKVDPRRLSGKEVIVGASAVELRDLFVAPRFGVLPGALLHALAAETIVQHRELTEADAFALAGLLILLAVAAAVLDARLVRPVWLAASVALAIGIELGAFGLQGSSRIILQTSSLHLALVALISRAAVAELKIRRADQIRSRRERDRVRTMLEQVVADNLDGILITNADGIILMASRLAQDMLGERLTGLSLAAVLPPPITARAVDMLSMSPAANASFSGETSIEDAVIDYSFTVSMLAAPGPEGRSVGCFTFRNITERRRSEDRLRYLAEHDLLTGAWSRNRLIEYLTQRAVDKSASTLFIVDLKRFNVINETLGHSNGDHLLKQVVERLRGLGFDALGRVGGDSFAVVDPGASSDDAIRRLCARIAEAVCKPYWFGEQGAIVGVAIGVTTSALSGFDPEVMLSHAAMAQSGAKQAVGDSHAIFAASMDGAVASKRRMELELRQAISRGELSLAYQPQVSLATGDFVGAEALLRWKRQDGTLVPPDQFIPLAEQTGLIVQLGEWVMRQACADAIWWPPGTKVAVNVSPVQFELSDVGAMVRKALAAARLPATRLDIEITEGVFVSKGGPVNAVLADLRQLGIGIALDDFGTGYSSLGYVGRLPIDKIKIDQSFVRVLPGDANAKTVIDAIMLLTRGMGKPVVAEGVETEEQAEILRQAKCEIAQGYLFGRPMPVQQLRSYFAAAELRH